MSDSDSTSKANATQSAPDVPLQVLLQRIPDGVLVVDMTGRYIEANRAACALLGYSREELLNLDVFQVEARGWALHPGRRTAFLNDLRKTWRRGAAAAPSRLVAKSGAVVEVETSITPLVYLGQEAALSLVRAIRPAQGTGKHQQRLAALGQLAAGVGHELRNPLSSITNAVYFLNMTLQNPDSDTVEILKILDQQVQNCNRIIGSLLSYAHPGLPTLNLVDLRKLLPETLAAHALPERIKVEVQFDESLPQVWGDVDQLKLVFDNIIRNAVQAMPHGGGLSIVASVGPSHRKVGVAFHDSGVGILPQQLGRVFEPLFTTKVQGIGLGLAMSKQLVAQMGGRIEATSPASECVACAGEPTREEVGPGCTFTVYLLTAEEPSAGPDAPPAGQT